eukprot:NODE_171_length_14381_cov_0.662512.p11 type:complete len:161 gc:universal NODE_171_length_14381_cov_0.662512:7527-7045(-)
MRLCNLFKVIPIYLDKPQLVRQDTLYVSQPNSMPPSQFMTPRQSMSMNRNSLLVHYYPPQISPSISTRKSSSEVQKSQISQKSQNSADKLKSATSMDSIFTNEVAHAKMKYAFASKQDDELSLDVSETVEILENLGNGWTMAKSHGREGLVPTAYLEMVQ